MLTSLKNLNYSLKASSFAKFDLFHSEKLSGHTAQDSLMPSNSYFELVVENFYFVPNFQRLFSIQLTKPYAYLMNLRNSIIKMFNMSI